MADFENFYFTYDFSRPSAGAIPRSIFKADLQSKINHVSISIDSKETYAKFSFTLSAKNCMQGALIKAGNK